VTFVQDSAYQTRKTNGAPFGQDSAQQPNVRYIADIAAWMTGQQSANYNQVNPSRGAATTQMHYIADILYTQIPGQNSIQALINSSIKLVTYLISTRLITSIIGLASLTHLSRVHISPVVRDRTNHSYPCHDAIVLSYLASPCPRQATECLSRRVIYNIVYSG